MVTRVFPRFRQFASFHFEFSLALFLSSHWWLSLLWFWFYDTQFEHRSKKDDSSTLNMDITSCL